MRSMRIILCIRVKGENVKNIVPVHVGGKMKCVTQRSVKNVDVSFETLSRAYDHTESAYYILEMMKHDYTGFYQIEAQTWHLLKLMRLSIWL